MTRPPPRARIPNRRLGTLSVVSATVLSLVLPGGVSAQNTSVTDGSEKTELTKPLGNSAYGALLGALISGTLTPEQKRLAEALHISAGGDAVVIAERLRQIELRLQLREMQKESPPRRGTTPVLQQSDVLEMIDD